MPLIHNPYFLPMFNPFKIIFAIDRLLLKIENFLLIISMLALLFFAFLQVVLRNFFDSGIHWGDVFNRLLVLWISVFAATIAASQNKHLSIEMLGKYLPEKFKPLVSVLINLFVVVVTAFLAHASFQFFQDQIQNESSDLLFTGVPKAYFSVVFPVGFGILSFRYFVKLLDDIYKFAGGDKVYSENHGKVDDIEISVKIRMH